MTGAQRALPMLEKQTSYYWNGGAQGQLLIARCAQCGRYQHPPLERCTVCGQEPVPAPVSGRGCVASFTVNHEPWSSTLVVPFVFAAVELVEQRQLYVFANVLGPIDEVRIGMSVSVCFEQQGDIYLPMFRPDTHG